MLVRRLLLKVIEDHQAHLFPRLLVDKKYRTLYSRGDDRDLLSTRRSKLARCTFLLCQVIEDRKTHVLIVLSILKGPLGAKFSSTIFNTNNQ